MNGHQYRINNFIIEFKRLYKLNSTNIDYESWELKYESKYTFLIGIIYNRVHMLFKINIETLDVYGPRDIKPRGNLNDYFNGFNLFDDKGLIYNIHEKRKERRENELISVKIRKMEELDKSGEAYWKIKSLDYTVLNKKYEEKGIKSSESCEF